MSKSMVKRLEKQLADEPKERLIAIIAEQQSKLDGQLGLLREIHADLLQRGRMGGPAHMLVVNLGSTLWNRLCDVVETPK